MSPANNGVVDQCKTNRRLSIRQDDLSSQLEHATGLEDIKMAIEQLTLRSHGSRTSYSTSTYSSLSGSEGGEPMRRLIRHSSLETINTNVTVADEFVWVDSYNRYCSVRIYIHRRPLNPSAFHSFAGWWNCNSCLGPTTTSCVSSRTAGSRNIWNEFPWKPCRVCPTCCNGPWCGSHAKRRD